MVKAAYDQFCANGYLGTPITAIATDAGVAVPTIYYTFGTKARLLDEALGAAILGFDRWHEPPADPSIGELLPWHHWWADFNAAVTSTEALGMFLAHGVAILESSRPADGGGPRCGGGSGGRGRDPDRRGTTRPGLSRSRECIAAKAGGLRDGLTVKAATDVLVVLFSADCTNRSVMAEAGPRPGQPASCGTCCRHSCSAATVRDREPFG